MRRLSCLFLLMLVPVQGCGYRVAEKTRLTPGKVLAVRTLENESTVFQIEQVLTRSLIAEFVRRSRLSIVNDEAKADLVLSGRIVRLTANPVTFADSEFASTFLVTLYAALQLRDLSSGEVLFEANDYIFREQYIINADVKNFFSELNPALDRISEDFATSVVATLLEDF